MSASLFAAKFCCCTTVNTDMDVDSKFWSDKEMSDLWLIIEELDVIKKIDLDKSKSDKLYKEVQKQLTNKGYSKTLIQIRNKVKSTRMRFNKAVHRKKGTGRSKAMKAHYDILNRIFGQQNLQAKIEKEIDEYHASISEDSRHEDILDIPDEVPVEENIKSRLLSTVPTELPRKRKSTVDRKAKRLHRSPMSEVILYSHCSTNGLAGEISDLSQSQQQDDEMMKINFCKDVQWNKFSDGFPNLFIENVHQCIGKHVVFLGSFHSPQVVFEQVSLLYALPRCSIKSMTFILPYFPTGTMERIDTEGQVATAATMARILSSTPLSAMGPTRLMIFDIHALQERFFFTDNVIPALCTAIPRLLRELERLPDHVTIAFPDEGAHKRFSSHFGGFPIVRCIKKRNQSKREVTIVDGAPSDRHVVIVDDLVMTGGTILQCANTLLKAGAAKVSAYVTHAVFPQESWRNFLDEDESSNGVLDSFWITNSIPHAEEIAKHRPFKMLTLADSIIENLRRLTVGHD